MKTLFLVAGAAIIIPTMPAAAGRPASSTALGCLCSTLGGATSGATKLLSAKSGQGLLRGSGLLGTKGKLGGAAAGLTKVTLGGTSMLKANALTAGTLHANVKQVASVKANLGIRASGRSAVGLGLGKVHGGRVAGVGLALGTAKLGNHGSAVKVAALNANGGSAGRLANVSVLNRTGTAGRSAVNVAALNGTGGRSGRLVNVSVLNGKGTRGRSAINVAALNGTGSGKGRVVEVSLLNGKGQGGGLSLGKGVRLINGVPCGLDGKPLTGAALSSALASLAAMPAYGGKTHQSASSGGHSAMPSYGGKAHGSASSGSHSATSGAQAPQGSTSQQAAASPPEARPMKDPGSKAFWNWTERDTNR